MWKPISKEKIERDIEWCDDILFLNPPCLQFWNYIKIQPEAWLEKTTDMNVVFWVVGILGKSVIYYNDIEEGYNCSSFTRYGEIDDFDSNQLELYELIESMYSEISNSQ